MKKPTLLFANGRLPPPFSVGGDGISIHIFLEKLYQIGFNVIALGAIDPKNFVKPIKTIKNELYKKGIKIQYNAKKNHFKYKIPYRVKILPLEDIEKEVTKLIVQNGQDLILLTQLELSPKLSQLAKAKNVKLIYFIHDAEPENLWTLKKISGYKNARLIFNSRFTKNKFLSFSKNIQNAVIYPPLDREKYTLKSRTPRYITMINPVKVKGGEIFYKLARALPKTKFLAIKGWYDPIQDGIDFSKLENVTLWEKQSDIRKVFSVSKILLVPSQWEEGFGRIAAEALMAGVPVIASNSGGLKEAVGQTAILVNKFRSIKNWGDTVLKLIKTPKLQASLSSGGPKQASKFETQRAIKKLVDIISSY